MNIRVHTLKQFRTNFHFICLLVHNELHKPFKLQFQVQVDTVYKCGNLLCELKQDCQKHLSTLLSRQYILEF